MGQATRLNQPRIVLDTNVLVSALLFGGRSLAWLVEAWQFRRTMPLASAQTTMELIRVLGYSKFRLSQSERENLLEEYLPWCEVVVVDRPVDVPDCRDPDDRIFLELAVAAGADALVSGDRDLLALAPAFNIPILTPAVFQTQLA